MLYCTLNRPQKPASCTFSLVRLLEHDRKGLGLLKPFQTVIMTVVSTVLLYCLNYTLLVSKLNGDWVADKAKGLKLEIYTTRSLLYRRGESASWIANDLWTALAQCVLQHPRNSLLRI